MRHNGILPGYVSDFIKFPDESLTLVLFSNLDRTRLDRIARDVSAIVLGLPYDPPVRGTVATLTPQHLLYSRGALFAGGLRPHLYCLPILKRERHRQALVAAATSGDPKFFLGTDSAPHARAAKENACGCAGCYSAPAALPLYAEVFENAGALDRLEAFASMNGAAFYGLPRNRDTVTLVREAWRVPDALPFADGTIVPLRAGEDVRWRVLPSAQAL